VDRGDAPDRVAWQHRYPELAGELAEFFADQDRLGQVIAPFKVAAHGGSPARTEPGGPGRNRAGATGAAWDGDGDTLGGPDDEGGSERDRAATAALRLLGDYKLIRPLRRGAMGVVYEAQQVSLNRRVAVKMVRAGEFATEAEVQRLLGPDASTLDPRPFSASEVRDRGGPKAIRAFHVFTGPPAVGAIIICVSEWPSTSSHRGKPSDV
jgi:hypothetical protein